MSELVEQRLQSTSLPFLSDSVSEMVLLAPATAHGCIEPMPEIADVVSAVMASLQMIMGAFGGMLVSFFFDGKSAWSMVLTMLFFAAANVFT